MMKNVKIIRFFFLNKINISQKRTNVNGKILHDEIMTDNENYSVYNGKTNYKNMLKKKI